MIQTKFSSMAGVYLNPVTSCLTKAVLTLTTLLVNRLNSNIVRSWKQGVLKFLLDHKFGLSHHLIFPPSASLHYSTSWFGWNVLLDY